MLISCCLIIQKFQLSNYCGLFTLRWWAQCLIIWPLMHVRFLQLTLACCSIFTSESSRAELRERAGMFHNAAAGNVKHFWTDITIITSSLSLKATSAEDDRSMCMASVPSVRKIGALSNETLRGLSQIDLCQPPLCSAGCIKHPERLQITSRKLSCS